MGYILFGRNVENRDQLRRLTDDLRELIRQFIFAYFDRSRGRRVARMQSRVVELPARRCF